MTNTWEPALAGSIRLPFDWRSGHPEQRRGVKSDPTGDC